MLWPPFITNTHADILPAYWVAYNLAKVLHGDINVWSIMADKGSNGALID